MIQIICHRGAWKKKSEQNSLAAIIRGIEEFDGVEIDLRSLRGQLIVSHDPLMKSRCLTLEKVLRSVQKKNKWWALNIKQDGLAPLIRSVAKRMPQEKTFCFDLSGPEALVYLKEKLPLFNRISEYESPSLQHKDVRGSVVDSFTADGEKIIGQAITKAKPTLIISPELHGRPHLRLWRRLRDTRSSGLVLLCTDHPEAARDFFA